MSIQEPQLIIDSLAGDAQAFAKLYETYLPKIYRYHYYRTFRKETAEDLTSQTFLRALEHLGTYKPTKGSFSAWLYRIARNLLIDQVRAERPTIDIEELTDTLTTSQALETTLETKDQLERIKKYIESLSKDQREVVLLRLWDERSYAEIAEITQKSEAACKMLLSRTLKTLREQTSLTLCLSLIQLSLLSTYVQHS